MYEAKLDPVRVGTPPPPGAPRPRVSKPPPRGKKPKRVPPQTNPPWTPRQRRDSPPTGGRTETPRLGLGSILRGRSRNRRVRPAQHSSKTSGRCTFLGTNTPRGCRVLDPQT